MDPKRLYNPIRRSDICPNRRRPCRRHRCSPDLGCLGRVLLALMVGSAALHLALWAWAQL